MKADGNLNQIQPVQPDAEDQLIWRVADEDAGARIDKLIVDSLDGVSRTAVQQWIKDGLVKVNGRSVKGSYKAEPGDEVYVTIPEPEDYDVLPENIPLDIVYEDQDMIVINKPRGMVVHPAPGHSSGTLVNALLYHCKDLSGINGVMRPGIVHRIDKDTSGLLMAAKSDRAHTSLSAQLKEHSITRKYLAVVHGWVEHLQGTVDAPIGRDPKDRKMFTVTDRNSKHAVTHFAVVEHIGNFTLLELALETGRTHQIRVHMKFIGHPLVGDPMYGREKDRSKFIDGQALHAAVLGFVHPTSGQYMEFEAPLPEDMQALLHRLRTMT
jgi:23S rRNA pseudouridine1911/1915/1917 synthase